MNKKEITKMKKLYSAKWAKWQCYKDLYDPKTQMYTEGYSEYRLVRNLMLELGFNEFELYELEKTALDFTRFLRDDSEYEKGGYCEELFKYGYM